LASNETRDKVVPTTERHRAVHTIETARLPFHDGHSIPQIGLGVYKMTDEEAAEVVRSAIEMGYRLIDGAAMYQNEEGVGRGIRDSGIPRDEIFVTTKFWMDDLGYDKTKVALQTSLDLLGMDYVDLYMIHWPAPKRGLYTESWRALEDLHDEGLVRSIGMSNFHTYHLDDIFAMARKKPVINQIEVHPWLTQEETTEYNTAHGLVNQSWSPLARGQILEEPSLVELAGQYGKSVAQLIIRWHIQRGFAVVPKSVTPHRVKSNTEVFDFEISDDHMGKISSLNKGYRTGVDPNDRN
jgi:2,5-diketo-D-gluconate reductase A